MKIKRLLYYLSSWGQSHGFGVQSPSAFKFIRDVVRETYPYYAYSTLAELYHEDRFKMSLHRFLLRLSNKLQSDVWLCSRVNPIVFAYVHAGCKKTVLLEYSSVADVAILDLDDTKLSFCIDFYNRALDILPPNGVLLISNIHCSKNTLSFWHKVIADNRTGVCFDLYECGVVFFDLLMNKKVYKVMLP